MTTLSRWTTSRHLALSVAAAAVFLTITITSSISPALAAPLQPIASLHQQLNETSPVIPVVVVRHGGAVGPRGVARRTTVVGPRGAASRTVVRGRPVGPGRWARPGWYRWPVGGAIAAGAAVGFVTAASAAAWAGAPPAPGMCWYYTDASRTQGFWDYCP